MREAGSAEPVARVKRCEQVKAGDAVLWVWPQRVEVVFPHPPYAVGDEFFVLDVVDEGNRDVWFQGNINPEGLDESFIEGNQADTRCAVPSASCWRCYGPPEHEQWWIEVRDRNGVEGWSSSPESFQREPCP